MAKSKRDLKVEEWRGEIQEGLRFRYKYGLEAEWGNLEALYYNVHDSQAHAGPNIISSTGDALLSTLTVPNPEILVAPRRPDHVEGARVVESVDNLLVNELNLSQEGEDAVLSAFLWGVGFWKIGYDSEWGYDPSLDIGGEQMQFGLTASQFNKRGEKIEYDSSIRPGMPWVRNVLPHDIVVPWGVRDLERAPWIAHRVVRHVDDVKSDPKYSNTSKLQPVMSMEDFVRSYHHPQHSHRIWSVSQRGTSDMEYVELYEIHDMRTGKILVVATGHDKFLRKDDNELDLNGPPFVAIRFTPNARSLWTTPDAYYLRQAQSELSDISLQAAKQRRLASLKIIADEDAFDNEELEKATSPHVGPVIKKKSGKPMQESLMALQMGQNFELYQESEFTRRNAREMVGFSRNQFGEFEQTGRRTATEAGIVDRSAQLRMTRRQAAMKELYEQAFSKVNEIIFEYWRAPQLTEVLSEQGIREWIRFNGPGIKGDYRYQISLSSEPEDNLQQRRMEALNIFMTLAQDPTVDPIKLRRYLVRAFNDPEFSSIFRPEVLEGDPNARLQLQMQQVSEGGGGSSQGGGQGQANSMQLPARSQNGEAGG